jgi:predicted nucleic acid-binding protein
VLRRGVIAVSWKILEVECFQTLDRVRLEGHLNDREIARKTKELLTLLAKLHLVAVSDEVIALARSNFPVNVRALDAVHVASAEIVRQTVGPMEFWTHDSRQATAALARGSDVRGGA